jgi:hypothetical protein
MVFCHKLTTKQKEVEKMNKKKSNLTGAIIIAITALLLPGIIQAGNLEPSGAPAPTMKTLDEIPPTWSQKIAGTERFELVLGNLGVLDKETGLVWEKSPSTSTYNWEAAINHCILLVLNTRRGWHLPTIEQLGSLADNSSLNPALSAGHPFLNVQLSEYWAASTHNGFTTHAWTVTFNGAGFINYYSKTDTRYAWCVRGGPMYDAR